MKIAYVYDGVYPWESGGVQKRVWELGGRLSNRHDVHWYGLKYWDGPPVIQKQGVTLHGVMQPTELYVDGRRSISEAVSFGTKLAPALLSEGFDLIDCQEFPYFPAFASKAHTLRYQSKFILTWHEIWGEYWYEYLGWKGVFGKAIERLVASLPDGHLAVSDRTRRDLKGLGISNADLVPNGISMAEIDPVEPVSQTIDVLFVGRLIPEKNVDLLIGAIAELRGSHPNIKCVILGDGPERETLESMVEDRDLDRNVEFTGKVEEYEDVLARMKAADIYALPSRREGFGISALEALACGTPVVTTSHPQNAAQELVSEGKTGAICDLEESKFAEGIERIRETASQSACIKSARRYEWDNITEKVEAVYERAVNHD